MKPYAIHLFMLKDLPGAYFAGVRVQELSNDRAITRVKHKWINQNPFKSIYFAVLAMAAELSTGVLVMQAIRNSSHRFSMLVVENRSVFHKKAVGKIFFTCDDSDKLSAGMEECTSSSDASSSFWMKSIGRNERNEEVATFYFKWSIKQKNQKA